MKKVSFSIYLLAQAAVLVAGAAIAEPRQSAQTNSSANRTPWYERFTTGAEADTGANAWTMRNTPKANIKVSPRSRWGVSFGLQEQTVRPTDRRNGQVSAGAFYDVAPNIRVGTAVVVPDGAISVDRNGLRASAQQLRNPRTAPSVKVESAFRF